MRQLVLGVMVILSQPLKPGAVAGKHVRRSQVLARAAGAVMIAPSSARWEPAGQASRSPGKSRARRATSRAALSALARATATTAAALVPAVPDAKLPVDLAGSMAPYEWTINGAPFSRTTPLQVRSGQRVEMTFDNTSTMWHPMHLHGHTFEILTADGRPGARKDTAIVLPAQRLRVAFIADNPGQWMLHCHNTYHQDAGMMTRLDYTG